MAVGAMAMVGAVATAVGAGEAGEAAWGMEETAGKAGQEGEGWEAEA